MKALKIKNTNSKFIFLIAFFTIVGLLISINISYHYFQRQLEVNQKEIVREAVELVGNSGKIPYKCPLKVLKSNLIIENEKVKEVHLTLACGDKTFKARVNWQNKKIILEKQIKSY